MFNEHKRNNMTAIQLVPISQHGPPLSSGEKQCGKKYAANKEHAVFLGNADDSLAKSKFAKITEFGNVFLGS